MKTINLLVTCDENYISPLNVMLMSVISSNPDVFFNVYLLHECIDEQRMATTRKLLGSKGKLIMIQINEKQMVHAPITQRYPKEMYYRIFASKYLPDTLDKVLYLDPDIVVINSLENLYDIRLEDDYYAAASHTGELLTEFNRVRLDMEEGAPYINSGVLLMNLQLLRKEQNYEEIYSAIETLKSRLILPDQDIISSLYGSKIMELDPSIYNMTERLYQKRILFEKDYDLNRVQSETVIVHYIGKNKPWRGKYQGELNVFYNEAVKLLEEKTFEL